MSILRRIFKRTAKQRPDYPTTCNGTHSCSPISEITDSTNSRICEKGERSRKTRTDSNIDTISDDSSDDDAEEHIIDTREDELKLPLNKLR